MDGNALASHLRAQAAGAFLLAVTGYGTALDRSAALAAGFDELMVKPVDLDALTALLRKLPPRRAGVDY